MDYNALSLGIARRKAQAAHIETEIILSCENAASRCCPKRQLPSDRSKWDQATWNRYLSEATKMEHSFGAHLRRIAREIEMLERQAARPLAA
jgi:hypothetical protein